MSIKKRLVALAGIGLIVSILAVGAAVALPNVSFAQSDVPQGQNSGVPPGFQGRGPKGLGFQDDTALADALGITTDELSTAYQNAYQAAIDQALEQDLITEAQANALRSQKYGGMHGLGSLMRWSGNNEIDTHALLADALGITTEELDNAIAEAQDTRLSQAVESGRLTQEQADLQRAYSSLQQYFQDNDVYADAVAQAVKAGVITQAQADAILDAGKGLGGFCFGGAGTGMMGGGFGHRNFDDDGRPGRGLDLGRGSGTGRPLENQPPAAPAAPANGSGNSNGL